jgi:UDP-N-acetylmuramate dehydrogenase
LISLTDIKQFFKGNISLNEPLNRFTTFRIGGEADYLVEPADADDLLNIIKYCNSKSMPFYVMGNGSNILISDDGIRGVVINLETGFNYMRNEDGVIVTGAGAKLAKFVDFCIQNNLAGVEMIAGIPATVGGALIMNAGCYGGETSTYVTEVTVIRSEKILNLSKEECGFIYRSSNLKDTVIMQAKFKLPLGDKDELLKLRKEFMLKRNESQPVEIPNAGCIFKNPKGTHAAVLIEECGLKGLAVGGAMVSTKHANFIVNNGNATANDVLELVRKIQKTVKDRKNIELNLEVKLVGFEKELAH